MSLTLPNPPKKVDTRLGVMARWFTNTNPGLRRFWHPVAALEALDGSGPFSVRLLGEDWVLFHGTDGWTVIGETCPHRLAPLTEGTVIDGRLECAYHGWCFDDTGTCVTIPALGEAATIPPTAAAAKPFGVSERYGLIWVALDEPVTDIPVLAEWDDERFGKALMAPQTWNASAAQMADNFLDVAHFPFTHLGTIGDPDDREVHPYSVEREDGPESDGPGWRFKAVHKHSSKVFDDATSGATDEFTVFERTMTFVCDGPHHVYLHIAYGDAGDLVLAFYHQPVDDDTTTLYCRILAENIADGRATPDDHIGFQEKVGLEDRTLLETLKTKAVPLDPGTETHTRADRTTVELRRILADVHALGVAAPTGLGGGTAVHSPVAPADISPPAANYAHARLSEGATRSLHTSGVVPIGPDGSVPADLQAQADVIWANIKAMLRDAAMTPTDVVSVTTYVTPGLDLGPIMATRDQALDGNLAASTLVVVPELARPEWLMEIAIVAEAG